MSMTTVKNMKRKVIISVEYPKGYQMLGFATIDLSKVVVKVFLKNGGAIYHDDIKTISIKAKDGGT